MFAILYCVLFIVVLTPIIFIGIAKHPELMSTLIQGSDTQTGKVSGFILQIKSFLEFFLCGTVSEFIRRKHSTKFKMSSLIATKIMFYFCAEMIIYILLTIMEVFI